MKRQKPEIVRAGGTRVSIYTIRPAHAAPYFQVADYSTGQRKLRTFTDHAEAKREADRIARALAAGETHAAQMRGPEAFSYGRAVQLLRDTGTALEIAASHYAEAFKLLKGDRIIEAAKYFLAHNPDNLPPRTVREVADELIANREARGKSDRYLQDLRARLGKFAEAFAVPVASVTTGDVQGWIDGLKVAPQTVENFRTVLGTLFNFAESRGYILKGSNPIEGTEKVSGANGDAVEIYTPEEIARLLAAAPKDFLPCIALGAFAGLRSAEVERLEWKDIDLAAGHIVLEAERTKTASRRIVPILPNLAAWLRPYAKKTGAVWPGLHDAFYDRQQDTATAAGVRWKPNALRHSFISYRLADIQNAAQVALEAGNSAAVVFKHYRELVKPADAKRWFNVRPDRPANVLPLEGKEAHA